tara:strand:+ start:457 stop:1011 length:555 start_codon:yes stop_codon:yes gene_type:complete
MKQKEYDIKVQGKQFYGIALYQYTKKDLPNLIEVYEDWIRLSTKNKKIMGRRINIPESLTEGLFCIFTDSVRAVNTKLRGVSNSFDCYDLKDLKTVQLKSASVDKDISSFGPDHTFDKLCFLDFSRLDYSFDLYEIPINNLKNKTLNKKGETFRDKQRLGKRLKLSLKKYAKDLNVKPKTIKFK